MQLFSPSYLRRKMVHVLLLVSLTGFTSITCSENAGASKPDASTTEGKSPWPPEGVSLDDDPSKWPGHMEELGSRFPRIAPDTLKGFPSVETFYSDYVLPKVPVVVKTAFSLEGLPVSDENLLSMVPQVFTTFVKVNGTEGPKVYMSIRKFLKTYQKDNLIYDGFIPPELKYFLSFPRSLACEEVLSELQQTHLLYRGGRWDSPLRRDTSNTLMCVLVSGDSHGVHVKMFNLAPEAKALEVLDGLHVMDSRVDVRAVDFTKYPALREVSAYHVVSLRQGDCLYVPALWFNQVSSSSNLALASILWSPKKIVPSPKTCGKVKAGLRLSDVTFPPESPLNVFHVFRHNNLHHLLENYVISAGDKGMAFPGFLEKLKKDKTFLKTSDSTPLKWDDECQAIAEEMFRQMDVDGDGLLSVKDFEDLKYEDMEHIVGLLKDRLDDFKDIIEDQASDEQPSDLGDIAKVMTGDYANELQKMLQDGFSEILQELNIPGADAILNRQDPSKASESGPSSPEEQKTKGGANRKMDSEEDADGVVEEIFDEAEEPRVDSKAGGQDTIRLDELIKQVESMLPSSQGDGDDHAGSKNSARREEL